MMTQVDHPPRQILLVDQNQKDYETTRDLLELSHARQFALEWASSYADALDKMAARRYDAVLIDYPLGERTGIDLIRELTECGCQAALILFTDRPDAEIDEAALRSGASLYLAHHEITPLLLERSIRFAIERKQADQELKRAQERFYKAFNASPDPMMISRLPDLKIQEVNRVFVDSFGHLYDEVIGRTSLELNLFVDPAQRWESIELLEQQGYVRDREVQMRTRQGEVRDVSLSIEIITIQGRDHLLTIAHDITRRKMIEEALRASEARYRTFFENLRDYVVILEAEYDERGEILDWVARDVNQSALNVTGMRREDFVGRRVGRSLGMGDAALRMKKYAEALKSDHPISYEESYRGRRFSATVFRMGENTIAVSGMDVTERFEAERALRESEERFRVALDFAPIVVFSQDRGHRYTWVHNPILGLSAEKIVGNTEADLWPYQDVKDLIAFTNRVLESGQGQREEIHIPTRGEWSHFLITAQPTFDERGAVTGLIGAAMDTTEIHRLQAQQVENEARVRTQRWLMEYRENERMKLARSLHDEPLQSLIAAQLELSQVDEPREREEAESLSTAQELVKKVINEIRMLALDLRSPTLSHLGLSKAIQGFADSFGEHNPHLNLILDLPDDRQVLPEDTRQVLYRIFQELMSNIGKHADATEVRITLRLGPDSVLLEVKDNGKGFRPPNQWIDLAYDGHLGLVDIYERLEVINGHLQLESIPGKGTSVRIIVPVVEAGPAI